MTEQKKRIKRGDKMESLIYYAVALSGAAALTKKLFDIIDILEGGAKK